MSNSKAYTLDMWKPKILMINTKQLDSDRTIIFNLKADGVVIDITGETVKYYIKKPDNTIIFNDCTVIDAVNGQIGCKLTEQSLSAIGTLKLEIVIIGTGGQESSFTVYLIVAETIIDPDALQSSSEFAAFVAALAQVQDIDNKFDAVNSNLAEKAKIQNNQIKVSNIKDKMLSGSAVNGVCFGDSLTWGWVPNQQTVQTANPYPSVLQANLRDYYGNNNITITNKGHSGYASDDLLNVLTADVITPQPDFVVMMIGTNDCDRRYTVDTYKANMITMIERILNETNANIILMTPPPLFYGNDKRDKGQKLVLFIECMRELANTYNLTLIDNFNFYLNYFDKNVVGIDTIFPDDVHMVDKGYVMLGNNVTKVFVYNNDIVKVDGKKVIFATSPYVKISGGTVVKSDYMVYNQTFQSSNTTGTDSLTLIFENTKKNLDLIISNIRTSTSGTYDIYLDGVKIKTVNTVAGTQTLADVRIKAQHGIDIGVHVLKIVCTSLSYTYINYIEFAEYDNVDVFNSVGSIKNINPVVLPQGTAGSLIYALQKTSVNIETGQSLEINADINFKIGSGFCWNIGLNSGKNLTGFGIILRSDSKYDVMFYYNNGGAIASYIKTTSINAGTGEGVHKIKIIQDSTTNLTVIIDSETINITLNTGEAIYKFGNIGLISLDGKGAVLLDGNYYVR